MICKTCGKPLNNPFQQKKWYCNPACEKQTYISDQLKNNLPEGLKNIFNI